MESIREVHEKLDEVEVAAGPKALVITGSVPGIFNVGFNVEKYIVKGFPAVFEVFV